MALPLTLVSRLEEVPRCQLERIGGRDVVQYRGEILPLIDVSQTLDKLRRQSSTGSRMNARSATTSPQESAIDSLPIVVCVEGNQQVGLIVGRILDIVHETITVRSEVCRPGALYTAVVQDRVTEFLDIGALLQESNKDFLPTTL